MASMRSIEQAAQAWCKPETEPLKIMTELALVFAEMLDIAYREGCDDQDMAQNLDTIMQGENK